MSVECIICKSESLFNFYKFDWGKQFNFFKCKQCKHCFVYPFPTTDELNSFYNIEYYVPDFQKLKVYNKASVCFKYTDLSKSPMLEIGCSYGYFLSWMKEKGVIVDGLELSQKAAQFAKSNGHNVFNGELKNLTSDKKYKTIFMFDVLEHLPNLNEIFDDLKNRTSIGSELILTVPNQGSLEFCLFGKYWEWVSPPAHLHYFNKTSITQLLSNYQFEVNYIGSFKGDSAGNIFFHFFDSFKRFILFRIGVLYYGKKRFLEKKMEYNLKKKSERQNSTSEFSGVMRFLQVATGILSPFEKIFRTKNNQATLLIKAVRI